jgi:hypothetical protein
VPEVRKAALFQVCIALVSLPCVFLGKAGIDFILGVLLGSINFLVLARVVQELVFLQKSAVFVQLFSFYGRLILTAVAFYLLIVFAEASVIALLLGISTVLFNILLWGVTQFLGKTSKEA